MEPNFLFAIRSEQNYAVVDLKGELDSFALKAKKADMEASIAKISTGNIAINLANLDFLNSEAVSFLFNLNSSLEQKSVKLGLVNAKKNVWDVLNQVGMLSVIPYFASEQEYKTQVG